MSGHVVSSSALARGATFVTRRVPAQGWLAMVARMARAIEERRILATLDDRMLADIGINRLEAERETARVPWDLERRG
ncbi:protein of unknown function [Roseomonas rosea]|uniref:YjiS-like domain-containing protein n=1 Tax=Muricoccus roseus TaxID=198092 RepID=A0A1M6T3F3_9PROT|nr:DUF1127 domain-containing protein [Roseomonas rosea]SHK51543.1 protein of unknown function [Roseomonas rosea]